MNGENKRMEMKEKKTEENKMQKSILKKFRKEIWRKFTKAVNDYELIDDDDVIGIIMDGSRENILLLQLFLEIQKHKKKIFQIVTFEKTDGVKVYDVLREKGATKIVLPDTFDDTIETILKAMFYEGAIYTKLPKVKPEERTDITFIRPLCLVEREDVKRWMRYNFPDYSENKEEKEQDNPDKEIKKLIEEFRKRSPYIVKNIYKSVENISLSTIISYTQKGEKHHFLDRYDDFTNLSSPS